MLVFSYPLQPRLDCARLTECEAAVVLLATLGFSNAAIAYIRAVRERTVANQLSSAYRKLGGVTRSGLRRALVLSADVEGSAP
jgi:DNA-binding NarL/FixJ family response regulator